MIPGQLVQRRSDLLALAAIALLGCGRSPLDLPAIGGEAGTSGTTGASGTSGAAGMSGAAGASAGSGGAAGASPDTFRSSVAAGTTFSCANLRAGLYCWGNVPAGTFDTTDIVSIQDAWKAGLVSKRTFDQVAAAQSSACTIERGGHVACGGDDTLGQAGVPPMPGCPGVTCKEPIAVPELEGAVQIAVSGAHGCAVLGDGGVRCWGGNDWGQLGHAPGDAGDGVCLSTVTSVGHCSQHPVPVDGLSDAVEVAVGADASGEHGVSCARLADGSVWCWGDNTTGAVFGWNGGASNPDNGPHPKPSPIKLPGAATRLAAGGLSVCAIVDGKVICWGDDDAGQGSGPGGVQLHTPQGSSADLEQVSDLVMGLRHTCAVRLGQVFCWGNNTSKQLGRQEDVLYDAPCTVAGQPTYCSVEASPVAGLARVVTLAAGSSHTCALLDDDSVRCWGSNINQQLGYQLQKFGDLDPRATPVKVQGLP